MATNGGIGLSDLLGLPVRQLNVLRKSVEIERISWRKQFIHDVAVAFSDPQKGINHLDNELKSVKLDIGKKSKSTIIWTPDEDAVEKLSKWKR